MAFPANICGDANDLVSSCNGLSGQVQEPVTLIMNGMYFPGTAFTRNIYTADPLIIGSGLLYLAKQKLSIILL
jgi:hypothetical protein